MKLAQGLESGRRFLTQRRVLIGIGVLALVIFPLIVKNLLILQEIRTETTELYNNEFLPFSHIKEADNHLIEIERNLNRAMLSKSVAGRSDAVDNVLKNEKALQEEMGLARKGISSYANLKRLSAFETLYAEYSKNVHRALAMMENRNVQGDQTSDYILSQEFQQVIGSTDKLLDEIAASKKRAALETLQRAEVLNTRSGQLSLVIVIAALLIGLASVFYVKSSYVKPIARLKTSVDELASGSLDVLVPFTEQSGHIGGLARSINETRASLKAIDFRLRLQARISHAVPADVEPVLKLIIENAMDGPFDPSVLTPGRQQEMAIDFKQALSTGVAERTTWENTLEVVPQDLWVYKIDGRVAAFALILGLNNKNSLERELHAIAVDPSYHGNGIGTELFDFFCRYLAGRDLYLQTRAGSRMMRMATARGFSPFRKIGTEVFLKRPSDFGTQALQHH
ncbi:MAG: GNAT family N-acetyltransferase [Proteobacteria bacterium]|nr:GNAT family N-acetyltransferase [Pseudomonadota bacterium]